MPKQISNTFTSYELSEQEQKIAYQLSTLNVAALQNLRSQIAEEKLALTFNPTDPLAYAQQEAYLKGQLDMLSYLLQSNADSQQFHTISE